MEHQWIKRIIAVFLVAATLMTALPLTVFAESIRGTAAAEVYMKTVKLAQAKTKEEAKKTLEGEGYIFLDHNLNEGTGEEGVWLGYTTTTDPKEAIYDLKLMNTDGGYSLTSMASVLKAQKETFRRMATDLNSLIEEFVQAYEAGSVPAKKAYKALNFFRVVNNETELVEKNGLGYQLVKRNMSIDELTEILLFCDSGLLDSVVKLLTMGIQAKNANWMKALSELGAYNKEASYGDNETELNRRAKQILVTLRLYAQTYNAMEAKGLVSGTFNENGEIENGDPATDPAADPSIAMSAQQADLIKNDLPRLKSYKLIFDALNTYAYGKGTLKDFFRSLETETDERVLYPLVSILTDGEFAALSYGCFMELALGADVESTDFSSFDQLYDELTKEVKSVYLYTGVNPALLEEDTVVGFTEKTSRHMALTGEYQFYEKESWGEDVWETGRYTAMGIGALGLGLMISTKVTLGTMSFLGVLAAASAEGATGFLAGLVKVCAVTGGTYVTLVTLAVALTIAVVTYLIYVIDAEINGTVDWEANPIPEYMYDVQEVSFAESSKNEGIKTDYIRRPVFVFYEVVRDIDNNPVDLNARSKDATQWIALYASYDRPGDNCSPIKAEDFLVRKGNGEAPEGYAPVTRFDEVLAYDLNQWDEDDSTNGLFMFFRRDQAVSMESDKTYYIEAVQLQVGESPTHCISLLKAAGYTPLNVNLSPDYVQRGIFTGEQIYTYLGYRVTTNPASAIRDLRVEYGAAKPQLQSGESVYAACGSTGAVTLYATKYKAAGTPILASGLLCVNNRKDAPAGYEPINSLAGGPALSFNFASGGSTAETTDYFLYFMPEMTFSSGETYLGGVAYYDYEIIDPSSINYAFWYYYHDAKSIEAYVRENTGRTYRVNDDDGVKRLLVDYGAVRAGYHYTMSGNTFGNDTVAFYQTHNPYRAIYDVRATNNKETPSELMLESKGYMAWNTVYWTGRAAPVVSMHTLYLFNLSVNGQGARTALEMNGTLYVTGNPSNTNLYDSAKNAMSEAQPIKISDIVCLKNGDETGGVSGENSEFTAVSDIFSSSTEAAVLKQNGKANEFVFYVVKNAVERPYVSGVTAMDRLTLYRAAGGADAVIKREDITVGMVLAQLAKQGSTNFADVNVGIYSRSFWGEYANLPFVGTYINELNTIKFGYQRTADGSAALRDVFLYYNGLSTDEPPREIMRGNVTYKMICEIPYNQTGYSEAPQPGIYLYGTTDKKAGNRIIDIEFSTTPFKDGYETVRTRNGRSLWAEIYDDMVNQQKNHFMSGANTLFERLAEFFGFGHSNDYFLDDAKGEDQYFYIHIKREGADLRTQKPYISELYLASEYDRFAAESLSVAGILDSLFDQGAEAYLNVNLNQGVYGDTIYLGYSYTADPSDAITSIRSAHMAYMMTDPVVSGVSYKRVGDVNLNEGADGDSIYLYYTKSQDEAVGTPITAIQAHYDTAPKYSVTDTAEILPVMRWDSWNPSDLNGGCDESALYLTVERPFDRPKGTYKAPNYGVNKLGETRVTAEGSEEGKYLAALYVMDKNTLRQEKLAQGVPSDQCTCERISDQEVFDRLKSMGATTVVNTPISITGDAYGKKNENKVFIGYSRTDEYEAAIKSIVLQASILSVEEPSESISIDKIDYQLVAEAAKKVTKLPEAINLIGTEDGQDLLVPRLYLYASTEGETAPIYDLVIDENPLKNGWVTVRSENGCDPFRDISEMARKQAELGSRDDSDSYDNDLIYTDELYKWMDDVADMFDPEDKEVSPFFIHCKKYEGSSIEEALPYIGEIFITEGDSAHEALSALIAFAPDGYIDCDLNEDAGGNFVYLAYKRTDKKSEAITDLAIFEGKNPSGSKRINVGNGKTARYDLIVNVDLNSEAGGDYLYLYATTSVDAGDPIRSLRISDEEVSLTKNGITESTVRRADANGFTDEDPDLNNGAGGDYLYLIAKRGVSEEDQARLVASLFGSGSVGTVLILAGIGIFVAFAVLFVKKRKNRRNTGETNP